MSCILSKFYIKPQLAWIVPYSAIVVSYRNSTSNHNSAWSASSLVVLYLIEILHQTTTTRATCQIGKMLYLIEILHQTTTSPFDPKGFKGCILSKFYIKPQLFRRDELDRLRCILSKFYIKPQPQKLPCRPAICCILSKFYIKPQLDRLFEYARAGCILSKFYIKPQRRPNGYAFNRVVSYRNSTSNHNLPAAR